MRGWDLRTGQCLEFRFQKSDVFADPGTPLVMAASESRVFPGILEDCSTWNNCFLQLTLFLSVLFGALKRVSSTFLMFKDCRFR
jgi:hypothetical protein